MAVSTGCHGLAGIRWCCRIAKACCWISCSSRCAVLYCGPSKRKRPVDFHQPTFYVFGAHGGTRSRAATPLVLARPSFRVPPARRTGALLAVPKNAKGRLTFINRPFMFLVPTEGLEPPHLAAHGPEPCASTNSATWAITAKERDYSRNLTAVNHLCVAIAYSWKWAKTICYIGRGALGK